MENNNEIYYEPKYTMKWLGIQCLLIVGVSFFLMSFAMAIESLAWDRVENELFNYDYYTLLSQSVVYSFAVTAITLMSLVLTEISFRKPIGYVQYALIGVALTLFYLLLLAVSEKLNFGLSYLIVSCMTIGLIALFVKGITQNIKAMALITGILAVEYAILFLLIKLGTLALLVGSLLLFAILALAMYFTLKLKIENEELILK